jgi:hypothetical protein
MKYPLLDYFEKVNDEKRIDFQITLIIFFLLFYDKSVDF